ncbi:TetR/AcrR family transcriptional regulator [Spongiactinospora sp. TRM90649]|uniref:TetR/AcrR family transcriptional regulator n=1 Tax=Spongiactinospora sp. TRM90649 TaxID=3031114 RepID=UPI0023F9AC95|nr:TetR/AcrR family transcriptional regulator [Spongiactinospora sp. TRM90649]MDF5755630.1 TetR/AcrR family transcriptional regulator [Spongiactinospora sp. TRM90649]
MRNRKVEQGEATRGALVDAAIALFTEKGYADSSTGEIVTRANVTRGALYHHFADKEQVFRAALSAIEADIHDRVLAATTAVGGDAAAGLRAGVDAFLDACLEPAVQRILLREGPSVLGWADPAYQSPRCARHLLTSGIEKAVETGMFAPQPAGPLSELLYGGLMRAGLVIAEADDPAAARAALGAATHRLLDALAVARCT